METPQDVIVGQVLMKIAVDADAASRVQPGELRMLEGLLALALERIRAELDRDSSRSRYETRKCSCDLLESSEKELAGTQM